MRQPRPSGRASNRSTRKNDGALGKRSNTTQQDDNHPCPLLVPAIVQLAVTEVYGRPPPLHLEDNREGGCLRLG